ncbi:MAG TPA: hypothetical protein VK595_16210 [Vicinamibacterales bacterium]|nr:hypothetical protein [Vicinamibacterales bacterium]
MAKDDWQPGNRPRDPPYTLRAKKGKRKRTAVFGGMATATRLGVFTNLVL